jgi:nucleoid DNA-binding protein
MNKQELIDRVAVQAGITKKAAAESVASVLDTIQAGLAETGDVQIVGFGSFVVKHRAARTGRNPQTGVALAIPESYTVGFKPGKALKEAVTP